MSKGWIPVLVSLVFVAATAAAQSEGRIYKIVNPDGSITFTDQKPTPDAQPIELKPLSVVETDIEVPDAAAETGVEETPAEPTLRDMRRMFRDFRIIQPQKEETFWGTENRVTVSWGASQPFLEDMRVVVYVNGEGRDGPPSGSLDLTLDRGEHQVYAVLRDPMNRRVLATETVTFFVKQFSENFSRPRPQPRN